MSIDERNFRSAYYEKVGFKNVEEKKSLEILLKEKNLDRSKLKQFCLRFVVPSVYRNLVWKVLLEVVPIHVDSHAFVTEQRYEECYDTIQALQIMRLVDLSVPKPQLMYAMWLIQGGHWRQIANMKMNSGFPLIVKALQHYFEDDTDLYWISKHFYALIQNFKSDIPKLIETVGVVLEKEDSVLCKHLKEKGIFAILPIEHWFDSCFADVLEKKALVKIWDKLCGGSYKILVYVVVVMLINQRHQLLKCTNKENSLNIFKNLSEETADIIANKAIETWQQYGNPLTIHDKPKP